MVSPDEGVQEANEHVFSHALFEALVCGESSEVKIIQDAEERL